MALGGGGWRAEGSVTPASRGAPFGTHGACTLLAAAMLAPRHSRPNLEAGCGAGCGAGHKVRTRQGRWGEAQGWHHGLRPMEAETSEKEIQWGAIFRGEEEAVREPMNTPALTIPR